MKAINIEWDATKEEIEECELPEEADIPDEIVNDPEYQSPEMWCALVERITDWLTDTYEFCIKGDYKLIPEKRKENI